MYAIRSYYVTDGEFRRTYFHIDFLEQLDGVEVHGGIAAKFHRANGEVDFAPPVLKVTGKVKHAKPIQLADFEFLKSVTKATPKVTIPSPTMLHFRGGRAAISKEAYRITSYNVCYTKLLRAFPYTRLLEPTSLPVRSSMLPMYAV